MNSSLSARVRIRLARRQTFSWRTLPVPVERILGVDAGQGQPATQTLEGLLPVLRQVDAMEASLHSTMTARQERSCWYN